MFRSVLVSNSAFWSSDSRDLFRHFLMLHDLCKTARYWLHRGAAWQPRCWDWIVYSVVQWYIARILQIWSAPAAGNVRINL